MYTLFTDETNLTEHLGQGVKFFAYGGLIIPPESFNSLDEGVQLIREEFGFSKTDSFKFDSNSRPSTLSVERFTEAKSRVINLCIDSGCKFLVYVVLHKIAEKQDINKTVKWGADHIVGKYNYYLSLKHGKGLVFVDRLSDTGEYRFLSEKFTDGLIIEGKKVPLTNIRIFSSTCDNASNFSSAMDIVLGSFRYCINRPLNEQAAKNMMQDIVKLLWAEKIGENLDPFEKGLTFRPLPENIKVQAYKKEYSDLVHNINVLLN